MFNPEKNREVNKLKIEDRVEKIVSDAVMDHPPLDYFKKLDKYNSEEIDRDKSILEKIEDDFEEGGERGEAMEIILADLLDRWFETEDMEVITQRTTKFDDVVNGVDVIVEFKTPDSIEKTALAVDASLSHSRIGEKLKKCYNKVAGEDKNFQVKYFQGQFENKKGEYPHGPLKTVVPMVVGLDCRNANKLFKEFSDYLISRERSKKEGELKIKKIESDSVKKIFMIQIKKQLDFYIKNSENLNSKMISEIKKIRSIVERISIEMEDIVCDFRQKDDWVLEEIEKFTDRG